MFPYRERAKCVNSQLLQVEEHVSLTLALTPHLDLPTSACYSR